MPDYDQVGSLHGFVPAVQSGQELESAERDNLGSVALMQAAIESATSGVSAPIAAVAMSRT